MVLGSSGDYGMEVFVGGRIWKEFAPKAGAPACDAFVESSLFVAGVSYQMETTECDPYGEEFTQSWPVTPYQVRLINRTATPVWFYLYVDGERLRCSVSRGERRRAGHAPGTGHAAERGRRHLRGARAALRQTAARPARRG